MPKYSKGGWLPKSTFDEADLIPVHLSPGESYLPNPKYDSNSDYFYDDYSYYQVAHYQAATYTDSLLGPVSKQLDMSTPWPHSVVVNEIEPSMSPYGNWDALNLKGGDGCSTLYVSTTPYIRGWIENGYIRVEWLCHKSCCYKFAKWAHAKELSHIAFTKPASAGVKLRDEPPMIDWELRRQLLAQRLKKSSPEVREEVSRLLQEAADVLVVDGWTKGVAHKAKRKVKRDYPKF